MNATIPRASSLAAVLMLLTACQSPPAAPQSFPDLQFAGSPVRLDVARIEVIDSYRPILEPPHVEERLPIPLPHALESWARERFQAAGSAGVAVVTITDAGATATPLAKQEGFAAQFTAQADRRYDLHAAVSVEIRDERGFPVRTANATAERSYTTLEDMSLAARDRELYRVEGELATQLDRQVEDEIRSSFGPYLR